MFPGRILILTSVGAVGLLAVPASSQTNSTKSAAPSGLPVDWSFRHIISRPSTAKDVGTAGEEDPRVRYRELLQQSQKASQTIASANAEGDAEVRRRKYRVRVDWSVPLGAGTVAGPMSPAKYSFDVNGADCSADFVVFALDVAGSANQPDLVRYNNLYSGTSGLCGSNPSVLSAYDINTRSPLLQLLNGRLPTSPVL